MIILNSIKMALTGIARRKMRSFLTFLGIMIGVAAVTAISSLGMAGQKAMTAEMDRMGFNGVNIKKKIGTTLKSVHLTVDLTRELKKTVLKNADATAVYSNYGRITSPKLEKDCIIWGVEQDFFSFSELDIEYGRAFRNNEITNFSPVAVIDYMLSVKMFGEDNSLDKKLRIITEKGLVELSIIGVLRKSKSTISEIFDDVVPTVVYVPVTSAMRAFGASSADYITFVPNNNESLDEKAVQVVKFIERASNAPDSLYAENLNIYRNGMKKTVNIFSVVLATVAAVSLAVGGVGVMNSMLVSVTERTREIGIKKVIGARNTDIMLEFLFESVIVTFFAGLTGVGMGILASVIITYFLGFDTAIDIKAGVAGLVAACIIGLVSGVYPALKAAKLNPVNALGRE